MRRARRSAHAERAITSAVRGLCTFVACALIGALASAAAALRIYADSEAVRLSPDSRGFLLTLERLGILSAVQREIVIDRLLALDAEELDAEQLKWVVLMVLSSQPGQETAFAQLEDLSAAIRPRLAH